MPAKKPAQAGKKKPGKKQSAKKATIANLINDAMLDTEIRSALYKNPRAVAKRYGLTDEEGKAMQTLKKSLLASLDGSQVSQLEAIVNLQIGRWGGCSPRSCAPGSPRCAPLECNPSCLPACVPNPCAPEEHL